MYRQPVHCLLAVPNRQNGDLASCGNRPYRFAGKTHQPYLFPCLYPSARITGKLNHRSLPNMRVVEAALRSDVEPDKQVVLAGDWSRILGRLIAVEIGF